MISSMSSMSSRTSTALIATAALYGLRWAATALHNHLKAAPLAAAGDEQAKAAVVERPEASLLGIPNSVYGIAYYVALLALTLTGRLAHSPWNVLARLATLAALARSATLLFALARTRTWCAVCMRGHAANMALAAVILSRRSDS